MAEPDTKNIERRMAGAVEVLHREFGGLRTGRASASLLEHIQVDAYGSNVPLNQVGSVNVPDPRTLSVQVWDQNMVSAVEKAIRDSGLGLNPAADGGTVRVPVPELSEERRGELAKVANKYSEQARIAVRNVRRDGIDSFKKMEKAGDISQDEEKAWTQEVQSLTDRFVAEIDAALEAKDKEIMQV